MLSNANNCLQLTRVELDLAPNWGENWCYQRKRKKKIAMQLYKLKHSDLQGYVFTSLWIKLFALPHIKRNRDQQQLKINFAQVSLRIYFSVAKTTFQLIKGYTELSIWRQWMWIIERKWRDSVVERLSRQPCDHKGLEELASGIFNPKRSLWWL